jgi:hypothetical protein
MRRYLIALTVAVSLIPVLRVLPSEASVSFSGGNTGIVGNWFSISLTTGLGPDATLAYGTTYTQVLGLEPLLSVSARGSLPDGWNVGLTASRGGLGGDYRVERLPEATVWRTAPLLGPFLSYTLEWGAANYVVRPVGLTGIRGTTAVTVSTAQIPLDSGIGVSKFHPSSGTHDRTRPDIRFSGEGDFQPNIFVQSDARTRSGGRAQLGRRCPATHNFVEHPRHRICQHDPGTPHRACISELHPVDLSRNQCAHGSN